MNSLNKSIGEYTAQLHLGHIQKAYKGIMTFMSDLRTYLDNKYPDYTASALYFGYMDMTYFAFTPSDLKKENLKIAIVFLHEACTFEVWLGGKNRKTQADYIEILKHKKIDPYRLSQVLPGVDSIIESTIVKQPDFDNPEKLKKQIEEKTIAFIEDLYRIGVI